MIVYNSKVAAYDLDDTLIFWKKPKSYEGSSITLERNGTKVKVWPNKEVIEQIKNHYIREHVIIIWTQANIEWAEHIIKDELKLKKYITMIMPKPHWLTDDLPPEAWLGEWILPDGTRGHER